MDNSVVIEWGRGRVKGECMVIGKVQERLKNNEERMSYPPETKKGKQQMEIQTKGDHETGNSRKLQEKLNVAQI